VVGLDGPVAGPCSLLLATRQGRRLLSVGRVEWGATRAVVARIRERGTILSGPVCEGAERGRGVGWIDPDIVPEASFRAGEHGTWEAVKARARKEVREKMWMEVDNSR
jgi:hypothetical protein